VSGIEYILLMKFKTLHFSHFAEDGKDLFIDTHRSDPTDFFQQKRLVNFMLARQALYLLSHSVSSQSCYLETPGDLFCRVPSGSDILVFK
jgi:hypothetical protein